MARTMRPVRSVMGVWVAAMAVGALLIFSGVALADQPEDLHCPAGWETKDDSGADDNSVVPPAGLSICVKAGSPSSNDTGRGNTGVILTDGETTLQGYLFEARIVDGSGTQGRDVSYWVTYGAEEPTATPTSAPTTAPTSAPTGAPTTAPTATPGEGVLPGNPTPSPAQVPDTAMPFSPADVVGLGTLLLGSGAVLTLATARRRRSN